MCARFGFKRVFKMCIWGVICIVLCVVFGIFSISSSSKVSAQQSTSANKTVFVIPVHGEFTDALYYIMTRAVREAYDKKVDAIVLDINSLGGEAFSALKIRDLLVSVPIPTYAYVNSQAISAGSLIAVACDKIIMGPLGTIGAALPITLAPTGATAADEKFLSFFSAEMRKTAQAKNHPQKIVEGFSNPDIEIPGLKEKGKILTLTSDEAVGCGLAAYQASTLDAVLDQEGFKNAQVVRFQETASDRVTRFLVNPVVSALLLIIAIGALFMELKTPGLGIPGAVSALAFIIYFFGAYMANQAHALEIIMFLVGLILIILEIFVIPGFGVAGILGILFIFISLFLALVYFGPSFEWEFTTVYLQFLEMPIYTMLFVIIALCVTLYYLNRWLPKSNIYTKIILAPPDEDDSVQALPESSIAPGDIGEAMTDLYPSGIARFGDRRIDVLTSGDYVKKGEALMITKIEGSRIFVRAQL